MKKRSFCLALVAVMLMSLLSGCMGEVVSVRIDADGSGKAVVSAGLTEEFLELLAKEEGSTVTEIKEDLERFAYNGVIYWGQTKELDFTSVEELNEMFNDGPFESETISVTRDDAGDITFKLIVTSQEDIAKQVTDLDLVDLSQEEIDTFMKDMAIVFDIYFPKTVYQTAGDIQGILVKDNHVKFDLMNLSTNYKTMCYAFTTKVDDKGAPVATHRFTDVHEGEWYYDAVTTMAIGGLVNGVGNGKFLPEASLTYAQFCQILANAKGLDSGAENGYWAAKAIRSCVDLGYIEDRGEITSANYDVEITREAAVAGMYRTKKTELTDTPKELKAEDIPDYKDISEQYKDDVLNAYNYGITSGVSSDHTFFPTHYLTRAQVCQLFYNLNWVYSVPTQKVATVN